MVRKKNTEIEFDEIFLDSRNLPGYDRASREGSLENPISKKLFLILGGIFAVFLAVFVLRLGFLQIINGEEYYFRSQSNYLRSVTKELARGPIFDRFGEILVKNDFKDGRWIRIYPVKGFSAVLGFLSRSDMRPGFPGFGKGADGLEAAYDDVLRGEAERSVEEINKKGEVVDSGILEKGSNGQGLATTIAGDLQVKLASAISETAKARNFSGGAGIFMDVKSGEILALVSEPDFDPNILVGGDPVQIKLLLENPDHPFLNRAIAGLYPPGSIVKPALASGVLNEKIIDPGKKILSTGSISLPNPYDPEHPNVFKDWRPQGWVDLREAIAVSSDVYFYEVGGGYQDQKGLGAEGIKKYFSLFGFADKTGVDLPGEKSGSLPDISLKRGGRNWTIGDTYHLAIGQGEITVTPIEMATYVATIANFGNMPYPHLVRKITDWSGAASETFSFPFKTTDLLSRDIFQIIHEGMRNSALFGTAKGLAALPVEIAAKTGTAEVGGNTARVHSWSMGFFPYKDPEIAYAIVMESGPESNTIGATYVAAEVIRWMADTDFLSKLKSDKLK